MTKRARQEDDDELNQALAILISNTRSSKRPLPLTEVARWLEVAVKKLGSYSAVAGRLGLSTKMLRQFSYVERLTPTAQRLVAARKLDSVDAITHLAMLQNKQQEIVTKALATGRIVASDVRPLVQLQRANYSASVNQIISRVKKDRTRREYIAEFVVRGSRDPKSIVKAFRKHISPKEIIRVELEGALGRLVLTAIGKKQLQRAARTLETSMNHVIPRILEA
jgi:hypothetical protein